MCTGSVCVPFWCVSCVCVCRAFCLCARSLCSPRRSHVLVGPHGDPSQSFGWASGEAVVMTEPPLTVARFNMKESAEDQWNQAITRKNNLFLTASKELLPSATAFYYDYGGVRHTALTPSADFAASILSWNGSGHLMKTPGRWTSNCHHVANLICS